LVNINAIDDLTKFLTETIHDLEYVQPDIMIFKENSYFNNKTKTAGFPDLTVKIWSDGNKLAYRKELHNLYMTSPVNEVLCLNQEDTIIERWYKQKRLPNLDFRELIRTQDDIEFDLRDLAE